MTVYHIQSARVLLRNFTGKHQHMLRWFGENSRNFAIEVPKEHVGPLKGAGFNVRYHDAMDGWSLLIKIDPEYDTDLTYLEQLPFNKAEIYIEGREWSVSGKGSGMAAFLISITPEQ